MKKNQFLIVTPVLNGENFISECISSVKLAFQNFTHRHVIVDGGSIDNTIKIIKKNKHNNLILLKEPNITMYQAINRGFDYIKADYFYQLNVDDFVLPGAPELIYKIFQNDKSIDVISGAIISVDIESNYCKVKVPLRNQFTIGKIGINLYVNQPSTFIKYKVLKEIGGYNENYKYGSDTELWLKLIKKGYRYHRLNKCLSINYVHSDCAALSVIHIQEVKKIREMYHPINVFHPFIRLYNSLLFLFFQLIPIIKIDFLLTGPIKCFGNLFTRMYGIFFTTKRAGIIISYPFCKGIFGFKGRIF